MQLRQYQKDAIKNNIGDILEGYKKLGNILPTGSGKTEIFIQISKEFLDIYSDAQVLVLSHLSLLTTQTQRRFAKRNCPYSVGVLQASKYPKPGCQIVISTMQSSRVEDKIDIYFKDRSKVKLVIVDEMQLILNDSYEKIISYFPNATVVGFTATPFRDAYLITDYFDKISYSISMNELISKRYLVPPILNQIVMPTGGGDDVEKMSNVLKIYKEKECGTPAVIFMNTIENAEAMATLLFDHQVMARPVTSQITGSCRDKILKDFEAGKIKVLTTVNVLTAGFDAPLLEAIFMPYATSSPTQYMQRIGRAMRLCPERGKTECRIYCFGTSPSIKKGAYEKIHERVLGLCDVKDIEPEDAYQELEMMEQNGDKGAEYLFTMKVVSAARKFASIKCKNIEDMLIHHNFPKRYMNIIDTLQRNTAHVNISQPDQLASFMQQKTLRMNGFNDKQISKFTRREASALIAGISSMRQSALAKNDGVLPTGKYAGKHVSDAPYYYKKIILEKYPHSVIARIIKSHDR